MIPSDVASVPAELPQKEAAIADRDSQHDDRLQSGLWAVGDRRNRW